MTQQSTQSLIGESFALLDLGLQPEAVSLIDLLLANRPCRDVYSAAVDLLARVGDFQRAAAYADKLLAEPGELTTSQSFAISLAFSFAGRVQEAYAVERAIRDQSNDTSLVRLYGMACKSARLGNFPEALHNMLSCFRFKNIESWDAYRKIFIDSELASLWERIPAMSLSLREAMRFCNLPFDEILAANENIQPLRSLDHLDIASMPVQFRALLRQESHAFFAVAPLQEAANPGLYAEYVAWQESIVQPRLAVFRALRDRIRGIVINEQLAFAEFQAARGRVACARNHLVAYLQFSPNASLDDLPDLPALRPLIKEFREQYEESPEAFEYLISWKCKQEPETFIFDIHPEMPEVNRNSGYALLALGCMHYRVGNISAAIENWADCAKLWPLDDAPVMNATMLLSGEQRWEEATRLIERLPGECMNSMLWKNACNAIRERRSFSISNKIFTTPLVPTPTFGGLFSGADEEFLIEKKKFTPVFC